MRPVIVLLVVFVQVCHLWSSMPAWASSIDIQISWDKELAFPNDRDLYEKLLKQTVDQASSYVSGAFGFGPEKLTVQIHSRANYESHFGSRATYQRGAHYHRGAIHVNGGARLNNRFTGLLIHEMVHAFLSNRQTARKIPIWLNEGVAELLKWRFLGMSQLAPNQRFELKTALDKGHLLPLASRSPISANLFMEVINI